MGHDPKHQKISIILKLYGRKYPKSLQNFFRIAFKRNPEESGKEVFEPLTEYE
jgi:hypothetical protein